MFKEIRAWTANRISTKQVEFSFMDFYGPTVLLLETTPVEGYKTIEVVSATYRCEDASIDIGINRLMKEMAKELFDKNGGTPFYIQSKFGKIFVNSKEINEIFEEFTKKLILF